MANQSSNKPTSTNLNPQIVDSTNLRFPRETKTTMEEPERIPVLGIGFFMASLAGKLYYSSKKYHNALSAVRYWSLSSTCVLAFIFSGEGCHPVQVFPTVIVYPH